MAALTALALGLAFAGTATSVYGQVKAGKAAKKVGALEQEASNSEADLSDYNASVADLQAKDALDRGDEQASRYRQAVKTMVGSQRAGYAASGVDVSYGSAVDVQADTAMLGELDALTAKTNAAREAWGYKVQAADLRQRGVIARRTGVYQAAAGREGQKSAYLGAVGTIANTGASLLEARYGFGGPKGK